MVTQQERELAAQLARRQVKLEARDIADDAEVALRAMSKVILRLSELERHADRDKLKALKTQFRKAVFDSLQALKGSAEGELTHLHAIVDAMRREAAAGPALLCRPSLMRMRRVMARAKHYVEVLDAG